MTWTVEVYLWLTGMKINVVFTSEIILREDVEEHLTGGRRITCGIRVLHLQGIKLSTSGW